MTHKSTGLTDQIFAIADSAGETGVVALRKRNELEGVECALGHN